MSKKSLYKMINEEIGGFDFLSMDKIKKDDDFKDILDSKDFQTKLINDIAIRDYSRMNNIDATYILDDQNDNDGKFDFSLEFDYNYSGHNIPVFITIEGDHDYYEDSSITIFSINGLKIDFSWVEKNEQLKKKIVSTLVEFFKYQ